MHLKKIKRAIISVSNKSNLNKLLSSLKKYKIEIISSGGTFKKIQSLKYKCIEISDYTEFKAMLDGRIKTLHPKIYAGILNIRKNPKHHKEIKNLNIPNIDLVIVDLYPFEKKIKDKIKFKKLIEYIDIGGSNDQALVQVFLAYLRSFPIQKFGPGQWPVAGSARFHGCSSPS